YPHQKNRINILQAAIQGLGNREIPAHHLDLWRQTGRLRVASHGAEPRSRCRQLIDNLATDVPGAADDEDTIHRGPSCAAGSTGKSKGDRCHVDTGCASGALGDPRLLAAVVLSPVSTIP